MNSGAREIALFGGLALMAAGVFFLLGPAYGLRVIAEASCYVILAIGLTLQWGYGGLFNVGVMGFVALGGFITMIVSMPVNERFWQSEAPGELAMVIIYGLAVCVAVWLAVRSRLILPKKLAGGLAIVVAVAGYLLVMNALAPVAQEIESKAGFIGGFGLPVWLGWGLAGLAAGIVAWAIGHICLGLRSDYLAIATLGIAEIIKAVLKNADWLTHGTLTVSPLPWPTPTPGEIGFIAARSVYLAVMAVLIGVIYVMVQRLYLAPWGRMMRAIRDNETAAAAIGKNVNARRLQIFVLGSVIMGVGAAALVSFSRIFDPSGFFPLNHGFLVWVMVILGGAGNNRGAIFGAIFVYIIWTISEPVALYVFTLGNDFFTEHFGLSGLDDLHSRALQMRVFVIGLTVTLVLRYAPRGLIPERVIHRK